MRLKATRLLCIVLIANLAAGPLAGAQQAQIQQRDVVTTATSDAASNQKTPTPPDTQGPFLRAVFNTNADQGDYIPCEFTYDQLLILRPSPIVDHLTPFEAEAIKQAVISAAPSQTTTVKFPDGKGNFTEKTFVQAVGDLDLDDLTRSQALAKVMDLQRQYQPKALQAAADSSTKTAGSSGATESPKTASLRDEYRKKLDAVDINNLSPAEATRKLSDASDEFVAQTQKAGTPQDVSTAQSWSQNTKSALQQAAQEQTKNAQNVVDSARNTSNALTRPTDVGCAMSVLSSSETSAAFGRLAAQEYIAVQVVVRNLNPNQQFLIHDAELGVDSDLNGRVGRFYSARDQKVVRALVVQEKSRSWRNLVVISAGAIGTIANAAMVFVGPSFKDATGVYNGGFVPALSKAWADNSTDQLNRLNDVGFSASTDSKAILVPKSGAAMFVMFVPSKPFEQGWWTQSCAEKIATNPSAKPKDGSPETRQVGIYLKDAQTACQPDPNKPGPNKQVFKRVHYHQWSPTADEIFRELAFTVVSGTHIAEESKTTPNVSDMGCPTDKLGNIDFSKQVNGTITCTAKGTNFDKVVKMILRDAGDATDNTTAEGSVTINGDASTAKVDFPLAQIGPLEKPDYKVYTMTQSGAEDDAKQTLHLDVNTPFFLDVTPKTAIDLSKPDAKATIEVTGYHLDKIGKDDKIQLTAGSECSASSGSTTTGSSASEDWAQEFSLTSTALNASFSVIPGKTKVTGSGKLEICYDASGKQPQDLKLSVVVSGMYPDAPPAKAATPVKEKPKPPKPTQPQTGQ